MRSETYLGLGSNLGDRARNLVGAARCLTELGTGFRMSSVYETTPVGFGQQPRFYNAACRFWTTLGPFELLAAVQQIESDRGRRRTFLNAPRELDLDILLFGDQVFWSPNLTVPHPRIEQREFVLTPLAELAPGLIHPVTGETPAQMLRRIGPAGSSGPSPVTHRVWLLPERRWQHVRD